MRIVRPISLVLVLWACLASLARAADSRPAATSQPAAPGPQADSFRFGRPAIGTTYFYWYDVYTGAHVRNPDGTDALTDHPPASAMADLSYKSVDWHYAQLRDVAEAGIDFIMPVYWGVPGQGGSWSNVGLPPLVAAHDRMSAEADAMPGRPRPPRIGMFYDTSTLRLNRTNGATVIAGEQIDLTTDRGRDWFYSTIRDFFRLIPATKWARVDGRPIVFLYAAGFAKAVDDRLYDYTQRRFRADFDTSLFMVREVSWPGHWDGTYAWGGAMGLKIGENVAALGPGYDHSAVLGRKPLVVSRQNGAFYAAQWEKLLQMKPSRRPWLVHVETWNEWHEGTDVARSEEYGDRYIKATAQYAQMWHAGVQLDPKGMFARADHVQWSARRIEGVELLPSGQDGCWRMGALDDSPAATSVPCNPPENVSYLYFRVDDSYMFDEVDRSAEVTVVFRDDGGCQQFRIDYDNADPVSGAIMGAFRSTRAVTVGSTGTWRTAKLILPQARFIDRANNADFRLCITGGKCRLTVREVIVRRLPGTELNLDVKK